jgi:mono/diheme cytochrome c family protein
MNTLCRPRFANLILLVVALSPQAIGRADEPAASTPVGYIREVRPILAGHCFKCHGPDLKKGGLNLQDRASALKELKSGSTAVVPHKSSDSELIHRIKVEDPAERMPPKGEPLTPAQIATLKKWIDQGAKYEEHWSFVPPRQVLPPAVKNTAWVCNAIDNFVLSRLEREGLSPGPEADRATLIRRLSLDLTGLPPTPKEVDDFLHDKSPDAYEKVVDHLLRSVHYGEHMARWWLDFARYADTNGYEQDDRRTIWPYRDWVIHAFNRDLPFDRFTIEQIAGDLLPSATPEQKIATGFHRNTMVNAEGGTDDEEFRVAAVVDRVNTTATVWLGLTLACCQCHNHKYDPFSQKEFYQLFAFFNNTADRGRDNAPQMPVPSEEQRTKLTEIRTQIQRLEKEVESADLSAAQAKWEANQARSTAAWEVLEFIEAKAASGATLTKQPDGSLLAGGPVPEKDTYTITYKLKQSGITALRLEALPDKSLGGMGPGRTPHGNFVLTGFKASRLVNGQGDKETGRQGEQSAVKALRIELSDARADFEQKAEPAHDFSAKASLKGDPKTGWAIAPQMGKRHVAIFEAKENVNWDSLTITLEQQYGGQHTLGRFRISATTAPRPVGLNELPDAVARILATPTDKRTEKEKAELGKYYREIAPELAPKREQIAALRKQEQAIKPPTTLVMQELPKARQTFVHIRGNHKNPGDKVEPGVPAKLHALKASGTGDGPNHSSANRLDLARWLVDPANPLVGRVTMNRIWSRFFGRGLVETSEDFGIQGDLPTHPELLDWLASELVAQRWSLKAVQKQIVMSATYRQSSRVSDKLYERDPYNRLFARGPRVRLDAETVRDNALAISGLLNRTVGGPSVFPYQPEGVWSNPYSADKWVAANDGNQYRRGLYTFWRRTAPYAAFMAFDAPSREVACERRPRSNTPLQALATLNDKAFVECSAALARRMLSEAPGDDAARATFGFRCCVARTPTPAELASLLALYRSNLERYRKDPAAAKLLAGTGNVTLRNETDPAAAAAWTVVANVLLNLDETITKE